MSAEDYAADQLITSRGIQSSAVTDAMLGLVACITRDPPTASASSSAAAHCFNTSLYELCLPRGAYRPTQSSTLRLNTVTVATACMSM